MRCRPAILAIAASSSADTDGMPLFRTMPITRGTPSTSGSPGASSLIAPKTHETRPGRGRAADRRRRSGGPALEEYFEQQRLPTLDRGVESAIDPQRDDHVAGVETAHTALDGLAATTGRRPRAKER